MFLLAFQFIVSLSILWMIFVACIYGDGELVDLKLFDLLLISFFMGFYSKNSSQPSSIDVDLT